MCLRTTSSASISTMTLCLQSVSWAPAHRLWAGSEDFWIKVWDLAQQMAQNSYRAHSGQATCVAAFLHKDPVFLSRGEDNRILLEDICCPKPASQMGHGASDYLLASLVLRPQQTKVFVCGDENGTVPPEHQECKLCPQLRGAVLVRHWAGVLSTQRSPPGLCQWQTSHLLSWT